MASTRVPKSTKRPRAAAITAVGITRGEDVAHAESVAGESDIVVDLESLVGQRPTAEEREAWLSMSPALRRRAATRIELLRRWVGDRGELTAVTAAAAAGVEPNRFYQMASAWRRRPGLLAVGSYAAGSPDRTRRIDPAVNAALQAEVVKVIAAAAEGARSVEALRRDLEHAVRARVPAIGRKDGPTMPSPKTVRAIIAREQARVADMAMLGESVVLDCCPVAMRDAGGKPFALFCLIDRGTLRILGWAMGSLADSVGGYRRAAIGAREAVKDTPHPLPWAAAMRRMDIVVGADGESWSHRVADMKAALRPADVDLITRERRYGSQLRKYVGERIGGIWLRPTWVAKGPPPLTQGDEVFTEGEAELRIAREVATWNATKVIERRGGAPTPPDGLLDALRMLAE
ncbi:MAG: hypothetical protein E7773_11595 [Sphingomonas sp.]|uniref:hypothetical protein n=1 Tax=Sphingomonas sp. TaxID=28214 RepID=UPI0011FA0DDA|nr:hypothetical protein [Sphingomonas sp.]THD35097.1 MAG: hypothetical protein E7773_11595 [Sphingomonas sp.]